MPVPPPTSAETAARCHEIQVGIGDFNVPHFENMITTGMAVRLALHLRGLPQIPWNVLQPIATHVLKIPNVAVKGIIQLLAEVEFVKLITQGRTITAVVPDVPYYEDVYSQLGEHAKEQGFNEAEELSIEILRRLARAPETLDSLQSKLGADVGLFKTTVGLGEQTGYLYKRRRHGKDILLSPTFFSENAEIFADLAAGGQAPIISHLMGAIKSNQGLPLSIIAKEGRIGDARVGAEDVALLTKLAQDGAVKPPSIVTTFSGTNHFIFTPTPGAAALAPTKRDIYERALAVVAAIRQGQFLAQFRIRSPKAVIYVLKRDMKLSKGPLEATQQYKNIIRMRIAHLVDMGHGFCELRIIDTKENREAISIAYSLIHGSDRDGMEVDEDARFALQQDATYVESLVASATLSRTQQVSLSPEQESQYEQLLLKY